MRCNFRQKRRECQYRTCYFKKFNSTSLWH